MDGAPLLCNAAQTFLKLEFLEHGSNRVETDNELNDLDLKASLLRPQNRSDLGVQIYELAAAAAVQSDLAIVEGEESEREIADCIFREICCV